LVSLVTLAVAIGANVAVFSVVNGVLLKPLPFDEPKALVGVWHKAPGLGWDLLNQSPAFHFLYEEQSRVFDDIGMWDNAQVSVTGRDEPERLDAMQVTHGTLPILRLQPIIGRTFSPEDDAPGAPRTAMLGHGYWQRQFGGSPDAIGTTITVDALPREIIGVMPPDFKFLSYNPAILLPFQFDRAQLFAGNFSYQGVARLHTGVTIEQANADVERMIPLVVEEFPGGVTLGMLRETQFGANVRPLKQDAVGDVGTVLWVLLGTVAIVLLIACANVANLFLVRAEGRQQEVAIRTALGAGRRRIAGEFLTESLTLGALGGVAGVGLAYVGTRALVAMGPTSLPRLEEITLEPVVLLFALVISVSAGLLFGLFPALRYGDPNLAAALKEGGRGGGSGKERHRARNALVVSQIAMALVLVVASGLMIRSFQALRRVRPGFERPEEVLTLRIAVPDAEVPDDAAAVAIHEQIIRGLQALPGIAAVATSSSLTMDSWNSNDPIYVEDFPMASEDQLPPIRRFKWVSADYFATMGNPVLAGRPIQWSDIHTQAPVVVVTENFAREYWDSPGAAIGKRIRQDPDRPWREIVGVVGNVLDDGVDREATAVMYWPMLQRDFWQDGLITQRSMGYAIRTARLGGPGLLDDVRRVVWSINPNLPLANVRTLQEILGRSMARTSFTLVMIGIAGGVALLLGAVGIYGVISYVVSQRTREIGVRIALGAQYGDVRGMVLRHGLMLAGTGVGVGLAAAVGLTRLMSTLLFGVNPVDPVTYIAVSAALAGVALLASFLPARRAANVDPIEALRWE
jgi:predicted permease